MPELKWDELYINDVHYVYDPVNEEWFYSTDDRFGEQPVSEEVNELLNYIQSIRLPTQANASLKFMIDELKKTIEYKDLEIEKLRDQLESIGSLKYSSSNGSFPLLMPRAD